MGKTFNANVMPAIVIIIGLIQACCAIETIEGYYDTKMVVENPIYLVIGTLIICMGLLKLRIIRVND